MSASSVLSWRRRLLLLAAAAPVARAQDAAPSTSLRLGVIPYLPPVAVRQIFGPVVQFLQTSIEQPIQLFTATDFLALAQNTRRGDYDLAVLPAHLARVAVQDWGARILARNAGAPTPLLLMAPVGASRDPASLRGRRIATIDSLSITALQLRAWLRTQGLAADVRVEHLRSITNVLVALQRGEVDVIAVARSHIAHLSADELAQLQQIAVYGEGVRLLWTAARSVPRPLQARLQAALLQFTDPAHAAGQGTASGFQAASLRDTDSLEAFAQEARRQLGRS